MIKKKIDVSFDVLLNPDGLYIVFDDEDEHFVSWSDLIKQETSFFMFGFDGGDQKFDRVGFDEFDKIAEGLIDAGAEIKKILADSTIHD